MLAAETPQNPPQLVRVSFHIDAETERNLRFAAARLGRSRSDIVRTVLRPEAEIMAALARYVPAGHDPRTPLPPKDAQALRDAIARYLDNQRDDFVALQEHLRGLS